MEIKFVSCVLRDKLRNKTNNTHTDENHGNSLNHDKYLERNFWGYVKNVLNKTENVFPTFTMSECLNYFSKTLAAVNPSKLFQIPSWIPKFNNPQIQFDLDPPSYRQITTVIRKMKASGSPCPLDQISVICFKRCPLWQAKLDKSVSRLACDVWEL